MCGLSSHRAASKRAVLSRVSLLNLVVFEVNAKVKQRKKWFQTTKQCFHFCMQLFVGLGIPYEGPAALEALASGCVFINQKFTGPQIIDLHKKKKPTFRQVCIDFNASEENNASNAGVVLDGVSLQTLEFDARHAPTSVCSHANQQTSTTMPVQPDWCD